MHRMFCGLAATTLLFTASTATAQDETESPKVYKDVLACQSIAEDALRLQCFDTAVGALKTAEETDEIVMVDRQQADEMKRGIFGLSLPKLRLFGGGEDGDLEEITATITNTKQGQNGWIMWLDDGSVWYQTDGNFLRRPKSGDTIVIRRGALTSYNAKINGGGRFRIKRDR